ncbi:unnamed protein product [Lymnaea stagnalis]|uniref:Coiled-coil domain-containing protein 51 n=1 Tax=Lymnaea stagnalis TaxID=6523 RepID=A0AAV2I7J5_LYMST
MAAPMIRLRISCTNRTLILSYFDQAKCILMPSYCKKIINGRCLSKASGTKNESTGNESKNEEKSNVGVSNGNIETNQNNRTNNPTSTRSHLLSSSVVLTSQERLGHLMQMYEDFVGLTEVKQAQEKVVCAEQKFLQVQEDRRAMQQELLSVQAEVRRVGAELEKTSRTDTHYIELVKKEHEALLIEREMSNKIKTLDKAERDFFALLSAALRESHEKERARAEKTKYWSIIGSVIGAIIGIVGSTVNNLKRMRELRAIVTESAENTLEYKTLANKMLDNVVTQHSKLEEFVQQVLNHSETLETFNTSNNNITDQLSVNLKDTSQNTNAVLEEVGKQSRALSEQLKEIQRLLAVHQSSSHDNNVIYVGPELELLLQKTEQRLEANVNKNALFTITALGGMATLGVSVLIYLLRGSG